MSLFNGAGMFGGGFGSRVPIVNDGGPTGVIQGRKGGFLPHENAAFSEMGCPHSPEEEEAAANMGCPKCKRKRRTWTLEDPSDLAGFKPPSGGFPVPWGDAYEEEERRRKSMQGFGATMMRPIPLRNGW